MTRQSKSAVWKLGAFLIASSFAAASVFAANSGQNTATKEFQKTLTLGEGQTLSMEHKFGDLRIHGENGRDVKISATIRVQANTQGEADKYAEQVRLPADGNYDLSARTSFGHITSELPVTASGTLGGDSLNGKIGNGGCTLSVTNSNGNIEILKLSK